MKPRFNYQHYQHYCRPRMFPRFLFGMIAGGFIGYAVGRSNNPPSYGPFWYQRHHHHHCNQCDSNRNNYYNNSQPSQQAQYYNPQNQQAQQPYNPQYNPQGQQQWQSPQNNSIPITNGNAVNIPYSEENKPTNQN